MSTEKQVETHLQKKENEMFNKLFSNLSGFNSFAAVITWVQNLVKHFETDAKNGELKNEAIDAVIEILQAAKTPVAPAEPVVPPAETQA